MEHFILFIPLFALILDTLLGEPPQYMHPICFLGNTANFLEKKLRHDQQNHSIAFLNGLLASCICIIIYSIIPTLFFLCIEKFLSYSFSFLIPIIGVFFSTLILYICIAPNSLIEHIHFVTKELENNNLIEARKKLSWIVGRNTEKMEESEISRACIETLSENSVDCFFASFIWTIIGYVLFSFTGIIFFVSLHRILNTLDAMWGKRNEKYEFFGKFVARFDDVLNYIPARISFIFIIIACIFTKRTHIKKAISIGFKYRNALASPNSAWAEAPYAGALNLKLAGPVMYGDFYCNYPYIGEGELLATRQNIYTALIIYKNSIIIGTLFTILSLFIINSFR